MTYIEFRDKYNGQWVDWDGQYGAQCWDLAQAYFTECLGLPSWVLSGCGLVSNMLYPPKRADLDVYFDEVDVHNMAQGDVCIWEKGHIAILDNWDGCNLWFFSQNSPEGSCSKLTTIDFGAFHAFRLRKEEPTPTPVVTPNVERDEYKNQIEVKVPELRVRMTPSLSGEVIGYAKEGYYNYYEIVDADSYNWYRIDDREWIAYNEEWENIYPAKPKKEYVELEILDKKDDYVLVDLGQVYIKEK